MTNWTHNGKPVDIEDLKDYIGFVYLITDKETQKKYIGKKLLWKTVRMPPLKGKKRKRKKVVESDWKVYYGSSTDFNDLVKHRGLENFTREILHLCKTKGELSYLELYEQVIRNSLLDENYYNSIIQCRIHRNHVKNLQPENPQQKNLLSMQKNYLRDGDSEGMGGHQKQWSDI